MYTKKPPIRLEDIEAGSQKEEKGPGELTYVEKRKESSGMSSEEKSWKRWLPAFVAVFFAGILVFGFSATKSDVTILDANIREVNDRVVAVDGQIASIAEGVESYAGLAEKIDTALVAARSAQGAFKDYVRRDEVPVFPDLSQYVTKGEISEGTDVDLSGYVKKTELPNYDKGLSALEDRVTVLESGAGNGPAAPLEGVRWDHEVVVEGNEKVTAEITDVYPWKIEEEGYYELTLDIFWEAGASTSARERLFIDLTPRDRTAGVRVDEGSTWLETVRPSIREWDMRVYSRSDGTIRRITFTYPWDLDVGGANAGSQRLDLELNLVYK